MNLPGTEKKEPYKRLAEINRAITTSLNFDEVLDLIVENATQLVGARITALLLIDKNGLLRIRAARGLDSDLINSFSGLMEEDVIEQLHGALAAPSGETLAAVPVIAKSALNGLLVIVRDRPFDDEEEWQVSALADQAAIALSNARLYEMELAEASRERDETLEALRESNEKINRILSSITDLVYSLDLNWRFTDLNRQTEIRFGKSREELLGKIIWQVYPQAIDSLLFAQLHKALAEMVPVHFELESNFIRGVWFEAHAYPSEVGLTVYLRDISERKRDEEEREKLFNRASEARAEAEKANQLKDEFLATLSHELRNPLNVILGYSEVLLRSDEVQQSAFLKRAVEILRRNAQAQSQLVSDLLDLSRLHTGKLSLNRETVSLTIAVNNAVETVRAEAAVKNIEISVNAPDEVLFVDADPLRLEQVVWNLLNNAVKFTPAGGRVTVDLSRAENEALVIVKDTGQGIDPEFAPHLFEMFRQADGSSSRRHGGMGIGLALVQQLVALHNGSVVMESAGHGQGAKFTVRLPLSRETRERNVPDGMVDVGALNQMRILVVDDSEDTVEMLRRLFEMDGAIVSTAGGGAEALQIIREKDFDVILSDISMPEMDGFEFLLRLREIPVKRDVPVLALTGFGRAEDVERARAEGFFTHVTKPIDVNKLVSLLRTLPGRERSSQAGGQD